MTTICACGHPEDGHVPDGCLICSCHRFEVELRVMTTNRPYDWAARGDL